MGQRDRRSPGSLPLLLRVREVQAPVLEHIDRLVGEPVDLHTLASVVSVSAFHSHRPFSAWMGETLGGSRHRPRLEAAALRLVAVAEGETARPGAAGLRPRPAVMSRPRRRTACNPDNRLRRLRLD